MNRLFFVLLAVMVSVCLWASFEIPLWQEWGILKTSPWFLATLADLYIGLVLFSCFTVFIKKHVWHTVVWTILFFGLGNIATIVWLLLYKKDVYAKIN
jgi:hypothetical protein